MYHLQYRLSGDDLPRLASANALALLHEETSYIQNSANSSWETQELNDDRNEA